MTSKPSLVGTARITRASKELRSLRSVPSNFLAASRRCGRFNVTYGCVCCPGMGTGKLVRVSWFRSFSEYVDVLGPLSLLMSYERRLKLIGQSHGG